MPRRGSTKTVAISARTGRFVTKSYAKSHPATTVKMTVAAK